MQNALHLDRSGVVAYVINVHLLKLGYRLVVFRLYIFRQNARVSYVLKLLSIPRVALGAIV